MASSRVFFEEADRPPPAYFEKHEKVPLKKVPFQTPDPKKWITAPEFVPRPKQPAADYHPDSPITPFTPFFAPNDSPYFPPPQMPPNLRPPPPFTGIPPGYTANMTTINPTNGPPIAAILLRKKRRRRQKSARNSMVNTNHSISPCSSHPSDPNGDVISSGDDNAFCGSCPDLSEQQIQKWDDYLFETAQTVNEKIPEINSAMKSSFYEIAPPGLMESAKTTIYGTANKELQQLDNEINGNTMTSSMVLQRLANHTYISEGSTEKTLEDEMNELCFRDTKYGFPQIDYNDSTYVHITSVDPKNQKIRNSLIEKSALKSYLDDDAGEEEEDFLEGLNITVNNFDNCDDLTLSDIEQPTRFQQIQEAIRKNTVVISSDLKAPDRVCCLIM